MPYLKGEAKKLANARYRAKHGAERNARRNERRATKARPFVAIDSEGVSFGDKIVMGDGGLAQCQRTVFWGASSATSEPIFLNGEPYCSSVAIIEWLLSLKSSFGDAIFIWFGSSYDATQIFADLPYEKAWELQAAKPWNDKTKKSRMGRYVLWGPYALSYIKQKCLTIGRLRDPDKPHDHKGNLQFSRRIVIFDVFGFFQTSFLKAAKSIPGSMTDEDEKIIEEGKASRGDFTLGDIAAMQRYTSAELRVLARMLESLRGSLANLDLTLTRWQGAGSIAAALLKQKGAKAHFAPIASGNISIEQQWAHHAFFGGRIECLKQGTHDGTLWSYDVRSAYPFHMSRLPSMQDGTFKFVENPSWQDVEKANVLSMFQLEFECDVSHDPVLLNTYGGRAGPRFYPFPYRDNSGRILFPPRVRGIYMADEVRAAYDWIEHHAKSHPGLRTAIRLEAALLFEPGNDEEPMIWLEDMSVTRQDMVKLNEERGTYDLTEKVIKLGVNSVYGKTAQSVGNSDKPPGTACPWYAAAITAGTRAQLLRAALDRPEDIVAFQTDGIVSTQRLQGLLFGRRLGLWDEERLDGLSIFVQPGIYALPKKAKHRGIKADLLGTENFTQWLKDHVVASWKSGGDSVLYPYRQYLTLGASVASRERFTKAGWWVDGTRELKFNNLGHKRAAPLLPSQRKKRATGLVDTLPKPAFFHAAIIPDVFPLSEPHRPDWLDVEAGLATETELLNEEISMTNDEGRYAIF